MKVLMLTIFEYPHIGGLSTHMSLVYKGFSDNGHKVEVLSITNVKKIVRILLCSIPCKILSWINKDIGTLWINTMHQFLLTLLILSKMLMGNKYDIINCQDVLAGRIALRLKKLLNFKVIFTVHGYFVRQAISNGILSGDSFISRMYMDTENKVYCNVDSIISVDTRIKDYITSYSGKDIGRKITVLKNFIDLNSFRNDESNRDSLRGKWNIPLDKFVLFCPRRLVPKNGVIYPLFALNRLNDIGNTMLVYAGDGQERSKMEEYINENKLTDKVLMLGDVEYQSMIELYNICDVVLVPSVNSAGVEEATSISAIEGMASSKVVIASEIGGLKELITHGHNGILVKEKDTEDLVRNIVSLYLNYEKRSAIEHNARKTVETQLSLEQRIKDYIKIFISVLD